MPHDPKHDPYYEANRANWDERTAIHEQSVGYDRAGFLRGEKPLTPVELAELALLVRGQTLLHLQCHLGIDTLNYARLGATVTGIDFSPAAVAAAHQLVAESGIPGRFFESNVYDASEILGERFDIVYTGIGALNWLPDIRAWALVAAGFLRPGGILHLYEGHPMRSTLDDERADRLLVTEYPYFETATPMAWDNDVTYVDGPTLTSRRNYEWNHGLGEVLSAIIDAGLLIEFVHEHAEIPWQALPWLEPVPGSVRMWHLPDRPERLPMMYSIRAVKPA